MNREHLGIYFSMVSYIRLLMCNIFVRTQDCWTALISAAKEGHVVVVKELLDNNANVEPRDMVKIISDNEGFCSKMRYRPLF